MSTVCNLKLTSNQIASIIAQSNFSNEELKAIQQTVKDRAEKNNLVTLVDINVGDKIQYSGPLGGIRKSKVLGVSPKFVTVTYNGVLISVNRSKIIIGE
jgi:hypothetical protein